MFSAHFTLSVMIVVRVASIQLENFVRDRTFDEHLDGTNILRTIEAVRTVLACSKRCGDDGDCVAFYFTPSTQQCQVHATRSNAMIGLIPKPGARYYHLQGLTTVAPTTVTPAPGVITAEILTTSTTVIAASPVCPGHNGGWATNQLPDGTVAQYLVINDVQVNQNDADIYCRSIYGYLPKLVNAQKMDFYLNHIVPCPDVYSRRFWVDGKNTASNYDYITYDGDIVPRIPELWYPRRPNLEHIQHCIESRLGTFSYMFNDVDCETALHQILCEKIL